MDSDQAGRETGNDHHGFSRNLPPAYDGIDPRFAQNILPLHQVKYGHQDEAIRKAQAEGLETRVIRWYARWH